MPKDLLLPLHIVDCLGGEVKVKQLLAAANTDFRDLPTGALAILDCAKLFGEFQRRLWTASEASTEPYENISSHSTSTKARKPLRQLGVPALVRIPNPELVSSQELAWTPRPLDHSSAWDHQLQFLADIEAPTTFTIDLIHEQLYRRSENEVTVGRHITWPLDASSLTLWIRPRKRISKAGIRLLVEFTAEWASAVTAAGTTRRGRKAISYQEVTLASSLREDYSKAPRLQDLDAQMRSHERELSSARDDETITRISQHLSSLGGQRRSILEELHLAGVWHHDPVAKIQGLEIRAQFTGSDPVANLWPLLAQLATFSETHNALAQILIA